MLVIILAETKVIDSAPFPKEPKEIPVTEPKPSGGGKGLLYFNPKIAGTEASVDVRGYITLQAKIGHSAYTGGVVGIPPTGMATGLQIEPNFNVGLDASLGRRFFVYLSYNQQAQGLEEPWKVKFLYKGPPGSILRELSFGNIDLSLPHTQLISYSKNLFGVKGVLEYKNWTLTGIFSLPRSHKARKVFKGQSEKMRREITDTSYLKSYYYLSPIFRDALNNGEISQDSSKYYVYPNSLLILVDDDNAANNTNNPPEYGGNWEVWHMDTDFILYPELGVVKFLRSIGLSYEIRVAFKYVDSSGNLHVVGYPDESSTTTHPDYMYVIKTKGVDHWIYDPENGQICLLARNFYSIGATNLLKPPPGDKETFRLSIIYTGTKQLVAETDYNSISSWDHDIPIKWENSTLYYYVFWNEGILKFEKDPPFGELDFYTDPSSPSVYTLYIEYRQKIESFTLGFGIIPESVEVKVDGKTLERNVDFEVDPFDGKVTLAEHVSIGPESEIEILYEYNPMFSPASEMVVGASLNKRFSKNFNMRLTGLWNTKGSAQQVPDPSSSPKSYLAGDLSTSFHLDEADFLHLFGFKGSFSTVAEGAITSYNPNSYRKRILGKSRTIAKIEDMESFYDTTSVPLGDAERQWLICAHPSEKSDTLSNASGNRGKLYRVEFYDKNGHLLSKPIDHSDNYLYYPGPYSIKGISHYEPTSEFSLPSAMVYDFSFSSPDQTWVGATTCIDKEGKDLSQYTELKLWVKPTLLDMEEVDSSNKKPKEKGTWNSSYYVYLWIDVGRIGEDIDEDGVLDTEDLNGDRNFDSSSEDVGLNLELPEGTVKAGYRNYAMDSEDLDDNGSVLPESQAYFVRLPSNSTPVYINGVLQPSNLIKIDSSLMDPAANGFIKITINLENVASSLSYVKNVRIWLQRGNVPDGVRLQLLIESMEFYSPKWKYIVVTDTDPAAVFERTQVNTRDDPSYEDISLLKTHYNDYYKPLYKIEQQTSFYQETEEIESAMKVNFMLNEGTEGYTYKTISSSLNLEGYQKLGIWLYPKQTGGTFFLRLGGDQNNYFEFDVPLDFENNWKFIEFDISDNNFDGIPDTLSSNKVQGSPSLQNIRFLAVGVKGCGMDKERTLYINDIMVMDQKSVTGWALRLSPSLTLSRYLRLNYNLSHTLSSFTRVEGSPGLYDEIVQSISGSLTPWNRVTLSGSWSETRRKTGKILLQAITDEQKYTENRNTFSINLNLRPPSMFLIRDPNINAGYSGTLRNVIYDVPEVQEKSGRKERNHTVRGSLNFSIIKLLGRHTLSSQLSHTLNKADYENPYTSDSASKNLSFSTNWTWTPASFLNVRLNLSHSPQWSLKKIENENLFSLSSMTTSLGFSTSLRLWIFSSIRYGYNRRLYRTDFQLQETNSVPNKTSFTNSTSFDFSLSMAKIRKIKGLEKLPRVINRLSARLSFSHSGNYEAPCWTPLIGFNMEDPTTFLEQIFFGYGPEEVRGDTGWILQETLVERLKKADKNYTWRVDINSGLKLWFGISGSYNFSHSITTRYYYDIYNEKKWKQTSQSKTVSHGFSLNKSFPGFWIFQRPSIALTGKIQHTYSTSATSSTVNATVPDLSLRIPLSFKLRGKARLRLRTLNLSLNYRRTYTRIITSTTMADEKYPVRHSISGAATFHLTYRTPPRMVKWKLIGWMAKLDTTWDLDLNLQTSAGLAENEKEYPSYIKTIFGLRTSLDVAAGAQVSVGFNLQYNHQLKSDDFWGYEIFIQGRINL